MKDCAPLQPRGVSWGNTFVPERQISAMVTETERDGATWWACDTCGMLFDDDDDAAQHEADCDGEEPSYIQ